MVKGRQLSSRSSSRLSNSSAATLVPSLPGPDRPDADVQSTLSEVGAQRPGTARVNEKE